MTTSSSPADVARELAPDGVLRVAVNLGNPVLVQGTPEAPTGVTVDIAHEVARRIGAEVELLPVGAARDAYAALVEGRATLGFLAVEPAREEGVRFSSPYVQIEGVHAVRPDARTTSLAEVDTEGTTIGVRRGSAYDLYLTRTLTAATIVRGDEAHEVFEEQDLDVLAGVRQPVEAYAAEHGLRVLEPAFQQIRQAVALPRTVSEATAAHVDAVVLELRASGFVAASLERAGQVATVPDDRA